MRDDENTVPVTAPPIGKETDESVVVLVETVEVFGDTPMVELHVFKDADLAEAHALHRHDVEMVGDASLHLDTHDRIASRQRWLSGLRRGRPMKLSLGRVIRMRPQKVRESV